MTSTLIDEIADGIYRLSTFVPDIGPTGFTFNQFLIDDDEPLLFHTGQRMLFDPVSEAIATVVPVEAPRWITFGHIEADECGSMNLFLAAAPAVTSNDVLAAAAQAEDIFGASCLAPATAPTIRSLADLDPSMLAGDARIKRDRRLRSRTTRPRRRLRASASRRNRRLTPAAGDRRVGSAVSAQLPGRRGAFEKVVRTRSSKCSSGSVS